ncbi:ABC transporter ATP-binding protein [Sedimentibacter sp. zth1]|uniref:ATP-binding cassette domain-containing protein n=1 Tax=Sedimentibacter sp. zth1 TaxID=2816908 RepID=UPI001A90ED3D|nr:ABC transporter ATP-binding protein [Sedimentibacter sp. zth1]QSX06485.1 ABC transporter ATP-binding protein [Sedimentibacter sp. zth1]
MSIEIKNVSKNFAKLKVLDKINIKLEDKKIYGLLGRNGSGKSTLLNIISDRINNYEGEIIIDGVNGKNSDTSLGKLYIMSDLMLYPDGMTVKKAFKWTKEFYPSFDMDYAVELSKKFKLGLRKKVDKFSTGYASIFKLIIGLSVNTEYVFYDEPVLGLDANFREIFYKELLSNFAKYPKTIIICSHLIDEISTILEHVFIINEGKIIISEDIDELLDGGFTITGNARVVDEFIKDKKVIGIESLGNFKSAYIYEQINKETIPNGLEISKLDLQKLFIELTNC